MESISVERLDHRGVVAAVSKDWGIIEMIDARVPPQDHEEITTGAAVAGMIVNGLGFAKRPMSLPPQFLANKPRDRLCRSGVRADLLHRLKLGHSLDAVSSYGCDLVWSALALAVCAQAGIAQRFHPLDPTSFSLTGDDSPDSDAHAIAMTYGDAKDHRPDLQQAVWELMVSQDGGVPLLDKSWDGHTSAIEGFHERAQALIETWKNAPSPR